LRDNGSTLEKLLEANQSDWLIAWCGKSQAGIPNRVNLFFTLLTALINKS
jgi:predicted small integral membrane protein